MYKKLLFVLLGSVFFMGHTVNYKAVINDSISEDINISISDGDIENPSNSISSVIKEDRYVFLDDQNNQKYNKLVNKNGNITNVNMKYTYDLSDFKNAKYFNICFENTTYIKKNNYVYIKGYGGFYCSSSNGMTIKLVTDKLVINNNADIVDGNTYIWNVKLKDYNKFELEFQVDLNKDKDYNLKGDTKIISTFKIIIGIIMGITIIVIIIFIDRQRKKEF